jgi:N-acetylglucosaminyldiphosphoundecaprenol N-acetyl-beta-D-mannosaminyltransferase
LEQTVQQLPALAVAPEPSRSREFAPARSKRPVSVAGVRLDDTDFAGVVRAVLAHAVAGGAPSYVVTPNAHHVVHFQSDPRFREIYQSAGLVVPDGVPLLWAAKLLGQRLNGRVNGTDLFVALCAKAADLGLRVFFLGGRPGAAEAAAARLRSRHPDLDVCGTYCPSVGFERDAAESAKIVATINAARPHLLFVGLGAPKQEYWMHANRDVICVPMSLGIGVSFEFVGGLVERAPRWMQTAGLEWLFRLLVEPRRLWKRYLLGNATFCALVGRDYLRYALGFKRPEVTVTENLRTGS